MMLAESFEDGLNCLQAAECAGGADPHQLHVAPRTAVFGQSIATRIQAGRDDRDPVFRLPTARLVAQIRIARHYEVGRLHGGDKAMQTAWAVVPLGGIRVTQKNGVVEVKDEDASRTPQ